MSITFWINLILHIYYFSLMTVVDSISSKNISKVLFKNINSKIHIRLIDAGPAFRYFLKINISIIIISNPIDQVYK